MRWINIDVYDEQPPYRRIVTTFFKFLLHMIFLIDMIVVFKMLPATYIRNIAKLRNLLFMEVANAVSCYPSTGSIRHKLFEMCCMFHYWQENEYESITMIHQYLNQYIGCQILQQFDFKDITTSPLGILRSTIQNSLHEQMSPTISFWNFPLKKKNIYIYIFKISIQN